MTAAKKLILSAALLAVGFCVARLLGRPDAPWLVGPSGSDSAAGRNDTKHAALTAAALPPAGDSDAARLVPDFSSENPYRARADEAAPPQLQSSLSAMTVSNVASALPPPAMNFADQSHPYSPPLAKLRDEAPRPLDFESRTPESLYTPALHPAAADFPPEANTRSAATDVRASQLSPAGFLEPRDALAAVNASYNEPAGASPSTGVVAPPPWPEPAEATGPRTHVVVDGDSLERLAGRYLDDSSRGHEIYEANRELLQSPELLPIGAELVIPDRTRGAGFGGDLPQSSLASDPAVRAAAHGDMVRVRPIPSAANVLPRAQLLAPTRAE